MGSNQFTNVNECIKVKEVSINGKLLIGVEIDLPGAPLILLKGSKGFVMCGYLDIATVNKLGIIAARVSGVKSVEELLEKEIAMASEKAIEVGIKPGKRVLDIIDLIA